MVASLVLAAMLQATSVVDPASAPCCRDRAQQPHAAQTIPTPAGADASIYRMIQGGVLGAAAGWLVGGLAVGVPLASTNPFGSDALDDGVWTPGMILGLELGQAVGIPVAVHLANGRQGNLRASLMASAVLATAGTLLLWTGDVEALEEPGRLTVLVAVPIAQLVTSIWLERRRRAGG
jgi:hypothetical protein